MSFVRPSLPVLITRIQQQLAINLPGLTPQLRRSVIQVLGMILGQELFQEYAYLDNFIAWFFVATAEGIYLDRKGAPIGVPREQGGAAQLTLGFTGISGYTAGQGAVLQSQDGSLSFSLNAAVTLSGGAGNGTVTALQIGAGSNLANGTVLTLVQAVAGINANATVTGIAVQGIDVEADDPYRIRILARQQLPPQGGAPRDYVAWAKLVAGVTRVWVYPLYAGAGTVGVAAVYDGRADIIPLSGDITNIGNAIAPLRPVTATSISIITLTQDTIAVTIANLVPASGYTKAQALANAQTSLLALFAGTTPGGATWGDGITFGQTGGTLPLEQISDAITQSAGVGSFDLAAPTGDVMSASTHIATTNAGVITAP